MTSIIFACCALLALVVVLAVWAKWVQRVVGGGRAGFTVYFLPILLTLAGICVTVIKS